MSASQASARARPAGTGPAPGFSEEAREAVSGAIDALCEWRGELADSAERHSGEVFDKMAAAAKALGWPGEFVDQARTQIEHASKLQLQIIDQVMDAWEQQMKHPGAAMAMPSAMLEKMQASFPGFNAQFPGMPEGAAAMNPFQFWMQAADMWQKSWASAMNSWNESQGRASSNGQRPRNSR